MKKKRFSPAFGDRNEIEDQKKKKKKVFTAFSDQSPMEDPPKSSTPRFERLSALHDDEFHAQKRAQAR